MAFIGVVLFEAIATTRRERLGRDGQRPVQGSACRAPNPPQVAAVVVLRLSGRDNDAEVTNCSTTLDPIAIQVD
jgi:hypothetical protein